MNSLYITLYPNTEINFQKIQTHFICLLWQLFFQGCIYKELPHEKPCMSKDHVQQLLTLTACVAEEFLRLGYYENF